MTILLPRQPRRPTMRSIFSPLLVLGLVLLAAPSTLAEDFRYHAVFVDGSRIEGNRLADWHDTAGQPKLEDKPLLTTGGGLRWLIDTTAAMDEPLEGREGFVEMVGGDRLPGQVVGYEKGHLLMRPHIEVNFPGEKPVDTIRIVADMVRRVVWGGRGRRDFEPGSLYYRDGRVTSFRSVRWNSDALLALLDEGPQRVEFHQLAEVHLPAIDAWDVYFRELAALSPDGTRRLARVETSHGVVLTASEDRFRASHRGSSGDPASWFHMLQPAWSRDAIWIPFAKIRVYLYCAPHEVPLSRLYPDEVIRRPYLGGGWHWQSNRNVQEGPLRSGGQYHGWGLGVQAPCDLIYTLSPLARSFRTKVGLDRVASAGGCARVRLFLNSTESPPLFESGFLIGSSKGVDTGELAITAQDGESPRLILAADAAHEDRPAGADPLDIRDSLDWLEPLITLDAAALQAEIDRRKQGWIPGWSDWQIDEKTYQLVNVWTDDAAGPPAFRYGVIPSASGLRLSRTVDVSQDAKWLLLSVRQPAQGQAKMTVRTGGQIVSDVDLPVERAGDANPLQIPLAGYQGEKLDVQLEISPGPQPGPIFWSDISIADHLPMLKEIFDEAPREMFPKPDADGSVALSDADPYSGLRCLRISKGDGVHLGGMQLAIRTNPAMGEYRYLRFALRLTKEGVAALELGHQGRLEKPFRYDAGSGPPALGKAQRVWKSGSPQRWVVVTRDLVQDFGEFDLEDLSLSWLGDSGAAFLDHIYLARTTDDFQRIGAQDGLSTDARRQQAVQAVFQSAIDKAKAALVQLDVEGFHGTGVLISSDGAIATTGYVAGAPGKKVEVTLPDGSKAAGITLGIDRDFDLGLVRMTGEVELPHLELGSTSKPSEDGRLVALAYVAGADGKPQPGTAIVRHHPADRGELWGSLAFRRGLSGGPLVNREGQLLALHSRAFGPGGTVATPLDALVRSRPRMAQSEVWGSWPAAVAPDFGATFAVREGKLIAVHVDPEGPAHQASLRTGDELQSLDAQPIAGQQELQKFLSQKLPGEEVTVVATRNGNQQTAKLVLRRRP